MSKLDKVFGATTYYYELIKLYFYSLELNKRVGDYAHKVFWGAVMLHHSVGQKYGDKPYGVHLKGVVEEGIKYRTYFNELDFIAVFKGLCYHDAIEDCRWTYADAREYIGITAADIVYACTNEKGKKRAERANDKFYAELILNKKAVFTKICDRLANMNNARIEKPNMFKKYCYELPNFIEKLSPYHGTFPFMFEDLEQMSLKW